MGQSYQQITARLAIDGIQRVRTPKKCVECGDKVYLISKRHKRVVCFQCSLIEKKVVRAIVAVGLMLLAGCQAPSKAEIRVEVAGQSVVMNFRK